MNLVFVVNKIFAISTVIGQLIFIFLLAILIFGRKNVKLKPLTQFVFNQALVFSFIVAVAATFGSLFYSEIAGYEPCKLCWLQRIFMYPLSLIFLIALIKKDNRIFDYGLVLSIFGAAIAAFHYFSQITGISFLPCTAVGYSVSCSQRFVMEVGYITIPLMSFTAFALIIIFSLYRKNFSKSK